MVQAYWLPEQVKLKHPTDLPYRQLFDFEKVSLAPGESTTVQFSLTKHSIGVVDNIGNLVSAPGKYQILITNGVEASVGYGQSSREPVVRLELSGDEQVVVKYPPSNP